MLRALLVSVAGILIREKENYMQMTYSVPEVAEMLGRDPSTIWKLVKRGKIYSNSREIDLGIRSLGKFTPRPQLRRVISRDLSLSPK